MATYRRPETTRTKDLHRRILIKRDELQGIVSIMLSTGTKGRAKMYLRIECTAWLLHEFGTPSQEICVHLHPFSASSPVFKDTFVQTFFLN